MFAVKLLRRFLMIDNYICKICNCTHRHQQIIAREMMFGFRDEFIYFKCINCGCLQIAEIPEDLSKYYPQNYYSYNQTNQSNKFIKKIKSFLINAYMSGFTIFKYIPFLKNFYNRISCFLLITLKEYINKKSTVLDIGCGSGLLLLELRDYGYANLTGIDPYIEEDIFYQSGVKILKQTVEEHDGKYDIIMLNHCFEHMSNPHTALKNIHKMLNNNGTLLIRVPVSDSFAFRKYQNNWYQLDAPRHFYLYTTKAMSYLAKDSNFVIKDIIYDSKDHQILWSEKYIRDITLLDDMKYTPSYIKNCRKFVKHLNKIKDGDQCCFILKKASG